MGRDLFGGILEAIQYSFRHLSNADPVTLALIAAGVVVVVYFLLKR